MSPYKHMPILLSIPAHVISVQAETVSPEQTMKSIFPQAARYENQDKTLSREQMTQIKRMSGVSQRSAKQKIWKAFGSNGNGLGWYIIDDVIGKHEFITYALGVSTEGKVVGIEILIYRETHGNEVERMDWRRHFLGKTAQNQLRLDEDIPNITGATLSCRNVTNGVKRLLSLWNVVLKGS